jgi:hypothetical protein
MLNDEVGQNRLPRMVSSTDTDREPTKKRLPSFIRNNTAAIVSEWEAFARTLIPSAEGMTPHALRDHIHQILAFVMSDMASYQTPAEQNEKSHGGATARCQKQPRPRPRQSRRSPGAQR